MTKIIIDIETEGLNPVTDKISCISYCNLDSADSKIKTFMGSDEKEIINNIFNILKLSPKTELIHFNGNSFDYPYLITRALVNNIPIDNKIQYIKNIDLRMIVNSFFTSYNKYAKGKLNDWASVLDGCEVKETTGLEMVQLAKEGRYEEIKEHCEKDVYITKLLYERCKECNLIR